MPPRLSATICIALLRPCLARFANTCLLPKGRAAISFRLDQAISPKINSPAARPPSTVRPSLMEPACHKNNRLNTVAPDTYIRPVLVLGVPSSRRITRKGVTDLSCHNGKKVKPSNNAMPLIVACNSGIMPGAGRSAARNASTACINEACTPQPISPPTITAASPNNRN